MVEHGLRLARLDTMIKLAGGIEVPSGDLLQGTAWVPNDGLSSVGDFMPREGRLMDVAAQFGDNLCAAASSPVSPRTS